MVETTCGVIKIGTRIAIIDEEFSQGLGSFLTSRRVRQRAWQRGQNPFPDCSLMEGYIG